MRRIRGPLRKIVNEIYIQLRTRNGRGPFVSAVRCELECGHYVDRFGGGGRERARCPECRMQFKDE